MGGSKMKIDFVPMNKEIETVVPPPKPAREYIPQWYKDMELFVGGKKHYSNGSISNKTVKLCMPFGDTFSTGYIQETWCDLYLNAEEDGQIEYHFPTSPELVGFRNNDPNGSIKIPDQFSQQECNWRQPWSPVLPKGYSMLITHPLNRVDLPFHTLSGIVDSDSFVVERFPNNLPFYLYKGFSGVIPAGTPMFQMIPIKRESWHHLVSCFNESNAMKNIHNARKKFYGAYRDTYWSKKDYK
jgi:hypothetical protein